MAKEIFTKSIIKEMEPHDFRRISVMSRHTLSDGITPDDRIIEGITYDEWLKEFAPPDKLIGAYHRKEISWDEYAKRYLEFLRSEDIIPKVILLAERCLDEKITLMCIEETPDRCHRRLLAEELKRYRPELNILHR